MSEFINNVASTIDKLATGIHGLDLITSGCLSKARQHWLPVLQSVPESFNTISGIPSGFPQYVGSEEIKCLSGIFVKASRP